MGRLGLMEGKWRRALLPTLSWDGGLCCGFGVGPPLFPGELLSSPRLICGERCPHLLEPSNRKGHALFHGNFQSCGLGVHVTNPAPDLANPWGPMWTSGGWDRPQPL